MNALNGNSIIIILPKDQHIGDGIAVITHISNNVSSARRVDNSLKEAFF